MSPRARVPLAVLLVPLFASSNARADLTACIAASEEALSLRHAGKLHDARQRLAVCAAASCPEELRAECGKRMEAVNAAMPSLVVGAKDAAGNDVLAAKVSVDGQEVLTALDGRPFDVDPGEHLVRVEAEGLPSVERRFVVVEGERTRRETFVLGEVPPPPFGAGLLTRPDAPTETRARAWGPRQTVATVLTGLGIGGLGAGSAFGLLASSNWSDSKDATKAQAGCSSNAACAAHTTAVNDHDAAVTDAAVSTVALGAGAALVVAGVVTWLTAPGHGLPTEPAPRARDRARDRFAFLRVLVVPSFAPGVATLRVIGELP